MFKKTSDWHGSNLLDKSLKYIFFAQCHKVYVQLNFMDLIYTVNIFLHKTSNLNHCEDK